MHFAESKADGLRDDARLLDGAFVDEVRERLGVEGEGVGELDVVGGVSRERLARGACEGC